MTGGVLFDFDGTLVDTFEDIVAAVQAMRASLGAAPLPAEEVTRHIGWGTPILVGQCHPRLDARRPDRLPRAGEPSPLSEAELGAALALFRAAYAETLVRHARVYPGMPELCRGLAADGVSLAVVSNKSEGFTRVIMAALGLVDPFRFVVGGDTLAVHKPDPAPLAYAARGMGLPVTRCVMVGDGPLDVLAARAAGVPCGAVAWGLSREAELIAHGPACLARTGHELDVWIRATLKILSHAPALVSE
jgi:phosphoglycolate phosphatase